MIVDILVGIFTLVCEFFSVLCSGLEFLCWVGEKLSYVASFFVCIGAAIFAGKSTYDINVREQKLLRQYYYSIFCPITEYQLCNLNSKHTSSYLSEKYWESKSVDDFLSKCSNLSNPGLGVVVFRW